MYHRRKDSDLVVPTDTLRFLNEACVSRDPEEDIATDGSAKKPWSLCTIDASKLRGKPVRISDKRRMGIGLFFSFLHYVTSAILESARRKKAIREGHINNPHAVFNMSAMWLIPQLRLNGMAEAFNVIGQNEFYYVEFPRTKSMFGQVYATIHSL